MSYRVETGNEEKGSRGIKPILLISLAKLMFLYNGNNKAIKSKD
jgi:hypothetical protein